MSKWVTDDDHNPVTSKTSINCLEGASIRDEYRWIPSCFFDHIRKQSGHHCRQYCGGSTSSALQPTCSSYAYALKCWSWRMTIHLRIRCNTDMRTDRHRQTYTSFKSKLWGLIHTASSNRIGWQNIKYTINVWATVQDLDTESWLTARSQ